MEVCIISTQNAFYVWLHVGFRLHVGMKQSQSPKFLLQMSQSHDSLHTGPRPTTSLAFTIHAASLGRRRRSSVMVTCNWQVTVVTIQGWSHLFHFSPCTNSIVFFNNDFTSGRNNCAWSLHLVHFTPHQAVQIVTMLVFYSLHPVFKVLVVELAVFPIPVLTKDFCHIIIKRCWSSPVRLDIPHKNAEL